MPTINPHPDVVSEARAHEPPTLRTIRFCSTCNRGDLGPREHHYSGGRECKGKPETVTYVSQARVVAAVEAQADEWDEDARQKGRAFSDKGNTARQLAKQIGGM